MSEEAKSSVADSGTKGPDKSEDVVTTETVDMVTDDPAQEKERLEKEVAVLEAEKERVEQERAIAREREDVERKAEEITRLINPENDSSEDDDHESPPAETPNSASTADPDKPKIPFWDFAVSHLLVGLGTLIVEEGRLYCGSCQKDLEMEGLRYHIEGDGHKLNTLWNYDKSLAEVTGELRAYPQKFEMEMFKHITMLNRVEKRYNVAPHVETVIRDLYKEEPVSKKETEETSESEKLESKTPTISPEELAEIKAEFIGSFPNADDAILVQQALMGELNGYSSESSAVSALRIAGMLGKMICAYQRKHLDSGYKVNEDCIRDIKGQCGRLLKLIDETKRQSQLPH